MMRMILFLDIDDVCRAPLAAALYQKTHPGKAACSAGVYAAPDTAINHNAVCAGEAIGVSVEGHTSRAVCAQNIADAKAVFCMTQAIAEYVRREHPEAAERIYALEIPDPFGSTEYEACAREIAKQVEELP